MGHNNDIWIYRIVVSALSFALLSAIGGCIYLGAIRLDIPDALLTLGGVVTGALAGLLAPSPPQSSHI